MDHKNTGNSNFGMHHMNPSFRGQENENFSSLYESAPAGFPQNNYQKSDEYQAALVESQRIKEEINSLMSLEPEKVQLSLGNESPAFATNVPSNNRYFSEFEDSLETNNLDDISTTDFRDPHFSLTGDNLSFASTAPPFRPPQQNTQRAQQLPYSQHGMNQAPRTHTQAQYQQQQPLSSMRGQRELGQQYAPNLPGPPSVAGSRVGGFDKFDQQQQIIPPQAPLSRQSLLPHSQFGSNGFPQGPGGTHQQLQQQQQPFVPPKMFTRPQLPPYMTNPHSIKRPQHPNQPGFTRQLQQQQQQLALAGYHNHHQPKTHQQQQQPYQLQQQPSRHQQHQQQQPNAQYASPYYSAHNQQQQQQQPLNMPNGGRVGGFPQQNGLMPSQQQGGGGGGYINNHGYKTPQIPVLKPDSVVYQVQFKLEFRYFLVSPHIIEAVEVNDFVIVEAEKGEDLGIVTELLTSSEYTAIRNKERSSGLYNEDERVLRHILRVANQFDCQLLPEKFHDEKIVVEHTAEVVNHILMLPMQIVSAEYQFDRTKLFIYYTANTRVDFRELVSKLFAIFKTCIWLKKLNANQTFEAKSHAVIALRTGSVIAPSATSPTVPISSLLEFNSSSGSGKTNINSNSSGDSTEVSTVGGGDGGTVGSGVFGGSMNGKVRTSNNIYTNGNGNGNGIRSHSNSDDGNTSASGQNSPLGSGSNSGLFYPTTTTVAGGGGGGGGGGDSDLGDLSGMLGLGL